MASVEIAAHPIFQVLGLADIDNGAIFILVNVAARTVWQQLQLMFNQFVHNFHYNKKQQRFLKKTIEEFVFKQEKTWKTYRCSESHSKFE